MGITIPGGQLNNWTMNTILFYEYYSMNTEKPKDKKDPNLKETSVLNYDSLYYDN